MALGTEYRIATRFQHSAAGADCWTIRNYRVTVTDGTDSATDLANSWINWLNLEQKFLLPTSVTIPNVIVALSSNPTVTLADVAWGTAGVFPTAKFFPVQIAGIIRLTYSGMSARHPGRWFQPYIPMWATSTLLTGWKNDFDSWRGVLDTDLPSIGSAGVTYSPVIWHRSTSSSSLVTGSLNADNMFYTQRRRAKNLNDRTVFDDCVGPL